MKMNLIPFFLSAVFNLYPQDLSMSGLSSTGKSSANHDNYWYVSGGLAAIVPKVSLGYRFQREKFGSDISFTEATIPPEFFSQALQLNQVFYPSPNINSEWYIGVSEGVHYFFGKYPVGVGWDASVGMVVGYQFKPKERRRHFIEGKLGVPIRISLQAAKYPVPIPSISYGISL